MQRKTSVVPIFLFFFILALIIFFSFQKGVWGGLEQVVMPIQRFTFGLFQGPDNQSTEEKLRQENAQLRIQLAKQKELEKENKALHDQFQLTTPSPKQLLPARIIGRGNEELIIDKGSRDKISVGQIVVFNDSVIGIVTQVSSYRAVVKMITSDKVSFTAYAIKTDANGVIYGREEHIIFGNVILSEKLEKDDLVKTRGDIDSNGRGFPPDLVVGRIVSINKRASSLFQTAEIESLVDFNKLDSVFVVLNN